MSNSSSDLSIRGESIQSLYGSFLKKNYLVNRRYQRKLIWTVEEKKAFIDSIIRGYPVPLILLAENQTETGKTYEIIDGMQRMNAIFSFIDQEFDIDGKFFDLDTMADTKLLKDNHSLQQKTDILDRSICAEFVRYTLPVSVFQRSDAKHIDEVFRRLNSGGRHLSKQELRQAGSVSKFADIVRTLSSKIRGDSSPTETLDLKSMQNISINNKKLSYGINIDDIFWIKNNIIKKDKLRDSQDEEVIADLVTWNVLEDGLRSSSEILDQLYEYKVENEESSIANLVNTQIQKINDDIVISNIQYVFDFIISLLKSTDEKNLNTLLFPTGKQQANIARYFQILFNALYKLLIDNNLKVSNINKLIKDLRGAGEKIINLSEGGGNWSQREKQTQTDALIGVIKKHFIKKEEKDISRNQWITRFENILMQSSTEQTMYDFKVGLYDLIESSSLNLDAFSQIIKTLTAMANTKPKSKGYCILGVADKESSANRYNEIYRTDPIKYSNFYINGIQDEAKKYHTNVDKYFTKLTQLINKQPISDSDKDYILRNIQSIRYFDKDIIILEIESGSQPSIYDNKYYVRHGSNVDEVEAANFGNLFTRFAQIK